MNAENVKSPFCTTTDLRDIRERILEKGLVSMTCMGSCLGTAPHCSAISGFTLQKGLASAARVGSVSDTVPHSDTREFPLEKGPSSAAFVRNY